MIINKKAQSQLNKSIIDSEEQKKYSCKVINQPQPMESKKQNRKIINRIIIVTKEQKKIVK